VNAGNGATLTPRYITLIAGSIETQKTDKAPLNVAGAPVTSTSNTVVVPEGSPAQTLTVQPTATSGSYNIESAYTTPTLVTADPGTIANQVNSIKTQINYTE
jgi:hypothetical protein